MTRYRKLGCMLVIAAMVPGVPAGAGGDRQAGAQTGRTDTDRPADIHPASGNRLPLLELKDLDEEARKLLAPYEEEGRSFSDSGPRSIRMYSPPVAEYMTRGNQYLRYKSGLDPKLRELTILLAARATDQQYEWAAHEETGRKVGLPQEVIDIVKFGKPATGIADEKQAAIIQVGREALYDHRVRPETFARAQKLFGNRQLVDIVALLGHYTATAILLTVFDQQLRPGQKPALPPLKTPPPTR